MKAEVAMVIVLVDGWDGMVEHTDEVGRVDARSIDRHAMESKDGLVSRGSARQRNRRW